MISGWLVIEQEVNICDQVTRERRFHLITNNCQAWVAEVVRKVEDELHIVKRVNLTELAKSHGYRPVRAGTAGI